MSFGDSAKLGTFLRVPVEKVREVGGLYRAPPPYGSGKFWEPKGA